MNHLSLYTIVMLAWLLLGGCSNAKQEETHHVTDHAAIFAQEKAAILATLNGETRAAFQRNYSAWRDHWVQAPYVTKTYLNFADSSMTETRGWEKVDAFVRNYLEAHPEPAPLPPPLEDIDLRLYGDGAWVSYQQHDPERGDKRETRLMEKEAGQWKIAGMHTTIYGFQTEKD